MDKSPQNEPKYEKSNPRESSPTLNSDMTIHASANRYSALSDEMVSDSPNDDGLELPSEHPNILPARDFRRYNSYSNSCTLPSNVRISGSKNVALDFNSYSLSLKPHRKSICFSQSTYKATRQRTSFRPKWDFERSDPHPACNPRWLVKLQRLLPWYKEKQKDDMKGPWVSARAFEVPYRGYYSELRERTRISGENAWLLTRFGLIACLIATFFVLNVILEYPLYDTSHYEVIHDPIHEMTTSISKKIQNSPLAYNWLLFLASLFMDFVVLLSWFEWVIFGDSTRLIIHFTLFYGLRAFMKLICTFPFPAEYKWGAPIIMGKRILSLVVPYQESDDFFYSGHVGCCALTAIEHAYNRRYFPMLFSIFSGFLESFVLIINRAHYVVDMVIGVLMAHYTHFLAKWFSRYIDQWLGLPARLTLVRERENRANI